MKFDEIDIKLLGCFKMIAKGPQKGIRLLLNLSVTAVYEKRIKRLEKLGVNYQNMWLWLTKESKIRAFTVLFVIFKLVQHKKKNIVPPIWTEVHKLNEVAECFTPAGITTYILKNILASMEEVTRFIISKTHRLKSYLKYPSSFVINEVKKYYGRFL